MRVTQRIGMCGILLGLMLLATACVVEPREGYYDHGRNRYYHEHTWHDCGERDEHCR